MLLKLRLVGYRVPKTTNIGFRFLQLIGPVRASGCKNRPIPFPGQMSYNATKPGLIYLSYYYYYYYYYLVPKASPIPRARKKIIIINNVLI